MFCNFFIRRPVLSMVLSLLIFLAGAISIFNLPVAQYPELTPPTVMVTASYPGANAQVISETVAAPLEQKINGVDSMIYMNSVSSANGDMGLAVYFNVGTDVDQAVINVNNRVQMAMASLPAEVRQYGITVSKRSDSILQVITVFSPDGRYDATFLGNYALANIVDELKRIPGVGDAVLMAANDYAMRAWLHFDRLATLKLTPADIAAAILSQNSQHATGKVGQSPVGSHLDRSSSIIAPGRLSEPQQFRDVILRADGEGSTLRLGDVADVELGAQSYDVTCKTQEKIAVPLGIFLSPGANALATVQAVTQKMAELSQKFPVGLDTHVVYDTTVFVSQSIREVIKTLAEAMLIVFGVVFLFLKNWRATLIPCLAVPVSIVGAFAGMMLFHFSINTLTLFGLVLAIGIVVDDAIIVLENVERIMRSRGMGAREATILAMEQVAGPLVAIVLVLCSVFVPVAFMSGLTGRMYQQFALTIAISVTISGIVALTLTPSLCVLFLGHVPPEKEHGFFAWFDRQFTRLTNAYCRGVEFLLQHIAATLGMLALLLGMLVLLFKITPKSLLPEEDQGVVIAVAILDPGASLQRSERVVNAVAQAILDDPAIVRECSIAGYDLLSSSVKNDSGTFFVNLRPWSERRRPELSSMAVAQRIMGMSSAITDGMVLAFNPPPIMGMSMTGGFDGYIQSKASGNIQELSAKVAEVLAEAAKQPELSGVSTTLVSASPQMKLQVDTEKVLALQVPLESVYSTMQSAFGTLYVNDFTRQGRNFKVMLQGHENFRSHPEAIDRIFVRSQRGEMIPLSTFVSLSPTVGADMVTRFNVLPAAKILGNPAAGYSSGQAIAAMERVCNSVLGNDYDLSWTGAAYQEKEASRSSGGILLLGLLVVFLILAAQYEKWSLPLAIIISVPFAIFGAIAATWCRGYCNDIYFQIALITLVGLAAKNAILIIEFAEILHQEQGLSLWDSAVRAVRLRFRPIVMTSLAFILGCLPLAVSSGAGAASRHSLGTAVIGGMLAATFIAPLFIPLFFVAISSLTQRWTARKSGAPHDH